MTNYELAAMKIIIQMTDDTDFEEMLETARAEPELKEFEMIMCETDIEDIADTCEISITQAKGVLGSLSKKGYVIVWENDVNGKSTQMMEPTPQGVLARNEYITYTI